MSRNRSQGYVYAIDWVRMATIIGVVLVHSVRFALAPYFPLWGGLMQMIFQYGRESFMVVTGFVLTYQYLNRTPDWSGFWRRRYGALLPSYLVWLAAFVALAFPVWPLVPWIGDYVRALPTGESHLYYVVLTLELYAVAPLFLRLVAWGRKNPWSLAIIAVLWELVTWTLKGYLGVTDAAPQMLVWTYGGYFLLGGLGAVHWKALRGWILDHGRMIMAMLAVLLVALGAVYRWEWSWHHSLAYVTNVFQPISVLYSLAVTLALFAGGIWFERARLSHTGLDRWVRRLGNASFGIYLIHPIFMHGWLELVKVWHFGINPWLNVGVTALLSLAFSLGAIAWIQSNPRLAWLVGAPRTKLGGPATTTSSSTQSLAG